MITIINPRGLSAANSDNHVHSATSIHSNLTCIDQADVVVSSSYEDENLPSLWLIHSVRGRTQPRYGTFIKMRTQHNLIFAFLSTL